MEQGLTKTFDTLEKNPLQQIDFKRIIVKILRMHDWMVTI